MFWAHDSAFRYVYVIGVDYAFCILVIDMASGNLCVWNHWKKIIFDRHERDQETSYEYFNE
jgi:hypothetical protein